MFSIIYFFILNEAQTIKMLLIYCVILLNLLTIESTTIRSCKDDYSMLSIKWPSTANCTVSQPPCLNQNHEFLYRCCHNNLWENEPKCYKVQSSIKECPDDFLYYETEKLCYIVTEKMKFPPKCPYTDIVPFRKYKNIVEILREPVWMPVRRDLTNGLGLLEWIEASPLYRTDFNDNYYATDRISGKNCLLYYNNSYIVAVDCQEEHRGICAYPRFDQKRNKLCDFNNNTTKCYQHDYNTTSKCICYDSSSINHGDLIKVEFLQSYQNMLYQLLTSETCLIGLEKYRNGGYIWSHSKIPINYTNWVSTTNFGDGYRYGAATTGGWILLKNTEISCILYEQDLEEIQPYLELKQANNDTLIITITNYKMLKWLELDADLLIYCFTDATPFSLLYRYPNLKTLWMSEQSIAYSFELAAHGPGHYWCESLKYPDLTVIKSQTLLVHRYDKFDGEFVAVLRMKYNKGTNPLHENIIEFIQRILYIKLGEIEHIKNLYIVRIMKILKIDEYQHYIYVNVHFTLKKQSTQPNLESEFFNIRTIIREQLSEISAIELKLISFKSADFCLHNTTNEFGVELTWSKTQLGHTTYPKEYCFKSDTQRLSRLCGGSFIDGADWVPVKEPCKMLQFSKITQDLMNLIGQQPDTIINQTLIITKNPQAIQPFDLYLISELFREIRTNVTINLRDFVEIVSNIHEIQKHVLLQAQDEMNATDSILNHIDEIVMHNNQTDIEEEFVITTKNVIVVVSHLQIINISAIILQNINNTVRLSIIYNATKIDDLINIENLESAILFNQQFIQQFDNNTKLTITLFLRDLLFNQDSLNFSFISKIYGVQFSKIVKFQNPITILHRIPFNEPYNQQDCSFWQYGFNNDQNIQGFWRKDNDGLTNYTKFIICEYWHLTHFALLLIDNIDRIKQYDYYNLLDIITYINCVLSLIGLLSILLTGVLFKRWRLNTGNQILMNFSLSITIQIVVFYISDMIYDNNDNKNLLCTIIGIILHYALISEFCWMFIIAILQFKRFVEVLGGPPKYVLLKACLCGWILPLLPVSCVFILDPKNYLKGQVGLCYPSGLGLYLGIWLPIAIIVIINSVIFIYIIYNVVHRKTECFCNAYDNNNNNDVLFQWRLGVLLFFMLGITWTFGLLVELNFGIIFIYLFCITSTLQGFVMFLFFIVFNKSTRCLYYHSIKMLCCRQNYY